MTLAFELDLGTVMVNQHAKYLGQRSFNGQSILELLPGHKQTDTDTHTHTAEAALPGPLKWSANITHR